jgi:hypothetical protein
LEFTLQRVFQSELATFVSSQPTALVDKATAGAQV